MKIEILSCKLIPPSSPTPPHLRNLQVSAFDQLGYPLYNTSIFYYPAGSAGDGANYAKRSEQLQKSLSEILSIYYPLAGRYIDEKYLFDCNDEGAEYLEAKVYTTLSEFLERAELKNKLRDLLVPYTFHPPRSPPLVIQFNKFECGGVAVGICLTHRIADGFTLFTFLQSWADVTRIGKDIVVSPSFELGVICPPKEKKSGCNLAASPTKNDKKIVTRRLVFSGAAISKLKAIASTATGSDPAELPKRQPTRVEVVSAFLWKALIGVSKARHGYVRPSVLVFPFDMRARTKIIPESCCGNLVCLAVSQAWVVSDDKAQLHDLVGHIQKTIRRGIENCEKASNAEDLFSITTEAMKEWLDAVNKSEVDIFVFNKYGFPRYEVDFGWGKPYWVSSAYNPVEMVFFVSTSNGDGIEAWVSLEENNMRFFLKNPDVIAITGNDSS